MSHVDGNEHASSFLSGAGLSLVSRSSPNSNELKSAVSGWFASPSKTFSTLVSSLLVEKPCDAVGMLDSTGKIGLGELRRLFMIVSSLPGEHMCSTGVLHNKTTKTFLKSRGNRQFVQSEVC